MRDELKSLSKQIRENQLERNFSDFAEGIWDFEQNRFSAQETYILDYKEALPRKFGEGYGAGIVRLCLAFYNAFGGIIVFGVQDKDFSIVGVEDDFDIESLNRALTEFASVSAECVTRSYGVRIANQDLRISAVIVPKRTTGKIARLTRELDKYKINTTWIRDRGEVIEVSSRHMPLLYSDRNHEALDTNDNLTPIHRSFPPSPATMRRFIERDSLTANLWEWLVNRSQPRIYLHGPGGSGKSTLAYEFARNIADSGFDYNVQGSYKLDYIIFISAKETEFDPLTTKEQNFSLRQFGSTQEQFAQILYHSGLINVDEVSIYSEEIAVEKLNELFSTFSGLIILDDIDALSRRQVDTGEETLLIKAVTSARKTKVLYTLRNAPAHAKNSALQVPGLEPIRELPEFIEECCRQFKVPSPTTEQFHKIVRETHSLPLLLEIVIGLRKFTGSYEDALSTYLDRGGDEARRYLYQREYDRLDASGKAKQVLAGLYLLEGATPFKIICGLYQFSAEHVRDALSEISGIFISTAIGENGETIYQLSPPCIPFIGNVSRNLSYFSGLAKSVEHFRTEGKHSSPEEAAIIVRMDRLLRLSDFEEIVSIADSLGKSNTILVNPRIKSFVGSAYSALGSDYREKAREWFRGAEGLGFRDVFMMRRWYNMELRSGYGLGEAERICKVMLGSGSLSVRHRCEFSSKLANCYFSQSQSLIHGDRPRAVILLQESIRWYFKALHEGISAENIDLSQTRYWMTNPVKRLFDVLGSDIEPVFAFFESLPDLKHDIDKEGVQIIFNYLMQSRVRADRKEVRNKIMGHCTRSIRRINLRPKTTVELEGFKLLLQNIDNLKTRLEALASSP